MPSHLFSCHLEWTGAERGAIRAGHYESYSREVRVDIAGKPPLVASAAPAFRGDPALYNPEDLLVASLSACHFLTYAALCARSSGVMIGLMAYEDDAEGTLAWDTTRKVMRFREVILRPRMKLAPGTDHAAALALHARAHKDCFIASSVDFPVRNEPAVVG
jgi:organic hydroperoxide reductase OsmC/OhrA